MKKMFISISLISCSWLSAMQFIRSSLRPSELSKRACLGAQNRNYSFNSKPPFFNSQTNKEKNPNDRMCFEDKLFMSILAPLGFGGFGICLYQNYKNEKK